MLYTSGAPKIRPIDIEGVFGQDPMSKSLFEQSNGLERVQDLIELAEVENFGFYYNQLKKFNLMTDLEKQGYSVKSFYEKDLTAPRASEINERFKELTPQDIIKGLKKQLVHLESEYAAGEEVEIESLADGIEELVESFGSTEEIGYPIQGAICNEIMNGALKGTLTVRSASSGLGKTRTAVMDACYLAYPVRYNTENGKWIQCGNTQKVLFIITEQQKKEIQKIAKKVSTVTGNIKKKIEDVNESISTVVESITSYIQEGPDWVQKNVLENLNAYIGICDKYMSIQYKSVEDYCKKKADTAAQDLGAEAAEKIKRLIIKNTRKKKIEIYNTTTTAMNAAHSAKVSIQMCTVFRIG